MNCGVAMQPKTKRTYKEKTMGIFRGAIYYQNDDNKRKLKKTFVKSERKKHHPAFL